GSYSNCGTNDCNYSGDYVCVRQELSLTNKDQVADMMGSLSIGYGGCGEECSDEALNTVINTLSANDPNRNQCGDFTTTNRPEARKIIILVTDAPPGSFYDCDAYLYLDTIRSNAFQRAAEAVAKGIQISTVNITHGDTASEDDYYARRDEFMHYYADTTGGAYTE